MDNTLSLFCPGKGSRVSEDAPPILDNGLLLVADGLGGSGGFAHTSLEPGVMSADTSFDTVFKNVIAASDSDYDKVKNYYISALDNYFSLDEDKTTDRSCDYKSGYFASRLVAAIFYADYQNKGTEWLEKTLGELSSCPKEELKAKEEALGEAYSDFIKNSLCQAAENGHFIKESKINSSMSILLPTTLAAIIYKEHESYVDAL